MEMIEFCYYLIFALKLMSQEKNGCKILVQSPKHSCCKALCKRQVDVLDIEVVWFVIRRKIARDQRCSVGKIFVFKSWINMTKIEIHHLASKTVFGL